MRSKKPNHISLRRLCSPPGNISSSAAERSPHSPLCPSCPAPHAASLLELTPGKHRHGHVLHEPFSSSRNQHKAASYFDILLYRARSLLCHPLPPGQAVWSWQLWFLRSQPWHHRTCECLDAVSSLPWPLCHPDMKANGMTEQLLVLAGSACVDFPSPAPIRQPAHQQRRLVFTRLRTFSLVYLQQDRRPSESFCYHPRLTAGQLPLPNTKEDIKTASNASSVCKKQPKSW